MVSIKWGLPGLLLAAHLFAPAYAGERDSIPHESKTHFRFPLLEPNFKMRNDWRWANAGAEVRHKPFDNRRG